MELQELQVRMDNVTDESLESTRNMLQKCVESEETGNATLTALYAQDEQLCRIEGHVDHINSDLTQAEESVERMRSCCCCLSPWRKAVISKRDQEYDKKWGKKPHNEKTKQHRSIPGERYSGTCDGYITRITGDDREVEMERNLVDVGHMVGNLRSMAVDMNNQLASESPKRDRVLGKVAATDQRIHKVDQMCTELL